MSYAPDFNLQFRLCTSYAVCNVDEPTGPTSSVHPIGSGPSQGARLGGVADSLESLESELLRLAIRESLRSPVSPSSVGPVADSSAAEASASPESAREPATQRAMDKPAGAVREQTHDSTSTCDAAASPPEALSAVANATPSGEAGVLGSRLGPLGFLKELNPVNLMFPLHEFDSESDEDPTVDTAVTATMDTGDTTQQDSRGCTPYETAAASAQSTPHVERASAASPAVQSHEASPVSTVLSHPEQAATSALDNQSQ